MTQYSLPSDFSERLALLRAAKILGVDMVTSGPDPRVDTIEFVYFAAEGIPELHIDCRSLPGGGAELLRDIFSSDSVKVFANAKLPLQFLAALGISVRLLFDVSLAGRLLYLPGLPYEFDTAALADQYLGEQPNESALNAELVLRLRGAMLPHIYEYGLAQVAEIEFKCLRAVAHMEYEGIYLNADKWEELGREKAAERENALVDLRQYDAEPEFQNTLWGKQEISQPNYDSNALVLDLLRRNGIDVTGTSKRDLLPYRENPLAIALTRYRRASKAISSFLRPIPGFIHPVSRRLHPQYDQLTAFSGRMSCSNPNIQQIPREKAFRECFTAPPGRRLVIADYSQIELRVVAEISADRRMLAAYRAGEDLHLLTASYIANKPAHLVSRQERQAYKAVNLGLIYGMGAAGLQQSARQSYGVDMTMDDATLFRRRFFETYDGIARWHRGIKTDDDRIGRTLTGRRFAYSSGAGLPERSNLPVQGTAADIIKKALGILAEKVNTNGVIIIGVVHDEILLECQETNAEAASNLLKDAMEEAANAILPNVPTVVEPVVADSWAGK